MTTQADPDLPGSAAEREGARVGADVGGTFTDIVVLSSGEPIIAKVPTDSTNQANGVLDGIAQTSVPVASIRALAHGTTTATNTLLERKGAKSALVTTHGFRDIIEIGRQDRPHLYDLVTAGPSPLVPRSRRLTLTERMTPAGVSAALETSDLERLLGDLGRIEPDAVAVCLLFSFLHPEHEQAIAASVRQRFPDVHVSVSSEVLPEMREFERFSTTIVDAYVAPTLAHYLTKLGTAVEASGLPAPVVMQSNGGVLNVEEASRNAASALLSGPAAGAVGAQYVASLSGFDRVLSFDMGGTSTDVAAIVDGVLGTTTESVIAGVPVSLPMVDIHTVSAGGGSIAWVDDAQGLHVGPESAGVTPGPAAYDRGGERATTTDANVVLGYLPDGATLGGEITLSRSKAEAAVAVLAEQLGMNTLDTAEGIIRVANAQMADALRVITVERGLDPRTFALVAFGGAGPMHACGVATELGIRRVLVPKASGVLSAFGLAISNIRRDYVRPVLGAKGRPHAVLAQRLEEMEDEASRDFDEVPILRKYADLRYSGQSFELTVSAEALDELEVRFHVAHLERYGYQNPDERVEIVNARLTAEFSVEKPQLAEGPPQGEAILRTTDLRMHRSWLSGPVFDRHQMGRGFTLTGPCIVELGEATCVVDPGWKGAIDEFGTLVLEVEK